MNGLGMIGYKSSSSVWCAWHVQILSCQCSNFPGGWKSSFQPPAGKKLEIKPGLKPGDWTCPNCGANVYASKFLGGKLFFRTFFAVFFGLWLQRIPVWNVKFWKPFFAYHEVPMATPKKQQHIIIAFMKDILKLHSHQPETDDPTTSIATLAT